MDTLLYERDMLRHCANTLEAKKEKWRTSQQQFDQLEYYLALEGFLLHFRNLIGFLINRGRQETDMIIGKPGRWAGVDLPADDEVFCRDLTARAERINKSYGINGAKPDCYGKISWFLQHCTVYRHQLPRAWDVSSMFAEITPILDQFFKRFAPSTISVVTHALGADASTTATITRSLGHRAF